MGQRASTNFGYGLHLTHEILETLDEVHPDFCLFEMEDMIHEALQTQYEQEYGREIDIYGYQEHEDFPTREDYEDRNEYYEKRKEFEEWWYTSTTRGQDAKSYLKAVDSLGIRVCRGGTSEYGDAVLMAQETVISSDWDEPHEVDVTALKTPDFEGRLLRAFDLLGVDVELDMLQETRCTWYLLSYMG